MKKELADKFNNEVEQYRKTLLSLAGMCEWDAFTLKAGNLFDYIEQIELTELERRFLAIFRVILFILVAIIAVAARLHVEAHPELMEVRHAIVFLAIAGACFELFFFLDFRMYIVTKMTYYKKRRARFIRGIQQDFKNFIVRPTCSS